MPAATQEQNTFSSETFYPWLETVRLGDTIETVMANPNRDFGGLAEAFGGVGQIAVIGWSSQGPAQAQNLRESLATAGLDTRVVVGLRNGSESRASAGAAGFDIATGTLMTPEDAIASSGLSLLLISDAAMAKEGQRLLGYVPAGATVGLSHGFYLGTGAKIRDDIGVIGVCPKGMGPSVRRLYAQGSGINTSFAVHQGGDMDRDMALGWARALGAPYTFQTTLEHEWKSDIFGERAMLLGGVHGLVEAAFAWKVNKGTNPSDAYLQVVESIVGPISETVSARGLIGLYESLSAEGKEQFEEAYNAAYAPLKHLTEKIYRDVSSGREIQEVVDDGENNMPMTNVDATPMWQVGDKVRANYSLAERRKVAIDPVVAGIYVAGMMAQVNTLRENGHSWSEVVNESIIEAVDSLNPYMQARGLGFMVDNCSVTARRGDRAWASRYRDTIERSVFPVIDHAATQEGADSFADFSNHQVHQVLGVLGGMRPPIRIAVD